MKVDPRWMEEFRQWYEGGKQGSAPGFDEVLRAYLQLLEAEGIGPDVGDDGHKLAFSLALRHGELTRFLQHKGGNPGDAGLDHLAKWYAVEKARLRPGKKPLPYKTAYANSGVSKSAYHRAKESVVVQVFEKIAARMGFEALLEAMPVDTLHELDDKAGVRAGKALVRSIRKK